MRMDAHYALRKDLVGALRQDLIGPESASDVEVIEDMPLTRYISGILYAQQSGTIAPSDDVEIDSSTGGGEEGAVDPPVSLANVRYPSSMGLTFAVDTATASSVTIHVSGARYVELEGKVHSEAVSAEVSEGASSGAGPAIRRAPRRQRWERRPVTPSPVDVAVTEPVSGYVDEFAGDGLALYRRVRKPDERGITAVTVVLVNTREAAPGQPLSDGDAFFQAAVRVTAERAVDGAFVERPTIPEWADDEDVRCYRLLYRNSHEFGAGHGCSIEWSSNPLKPERANALWTTFLPQHELHLAYSNPDIASPVLSMRFVLDRSRSEAVRELREFCAGYARWLDGTRETADSIALTSEQAETGYANLQACEEAVLRMRRGCDLLDPETGDANVWRAFRLMSRAMLAQRARSVWLRAGKPGECPSGGDECRWYPFQLAFILQCLDGVSREDSPDRSIADLLWFPTGGGKTEAYLGLIAFTVFLRRIRNRGAGVTALMRYTLRLLTIQQFERAALLICCCEALRREDATLGTEIAIGLWLGRGATPNTLDEARTALNKLRRGVELNEGNPVQLQTCPWCGHPFDHTNYWISDVPRRHLVVACRQADCLFRDGLPVYVVDEDVYAARPALVIATVDKFASLPWRESTTALFNMEHGESRGNPPDLIVQDELHLISGPLGTLVGLYETVIDELCKRNGVRPKVIASTATIRRAGRQTKALFDREIRQFPPPGIDAGDSYFAVLAPRDRKGTRLYVGVMAPGTSHATLLIRCYASLLQSAAAHPAPTTVKDAYWTLVGYFNSLRVLGGARLQVQDDVADRIGLLAAASATQERRLEQVIELTSREPSAAIPQHLRHMGVSLPDPATLDVIFATNMISVGVDIDRLGLMAVMGQPQTTSEYIQATSRVGRQQPGLALVMLNAARSRDRSHYESFVAYHSALYRQVEATTVTPFSARARDRGLHAVVVALARALVPGLGANDSADKVERHLGRLRQLRDVITSRVASVAPDEADATAEQLDEIIALWAERVRSGPIVYSDRTDTAGSLLCDASLSGLDAGDGFATLWSLRDVDQESNLYLL